MNKYKFILILLGAFFSLSTSVVLGQGISVVTSNPLLIDTTALDLKDVQEKYKDLSGEEVEKFKQFDNSSGIERGDLTGGVGDEETGNTVDKQEESGTIIEDGNESQETAEKIIEAVATENKEMLEEVKIYGFRYFRESKTKLYSSAQDVKPPYNYILGVGDQLNIAIWGFADYNEVFTIEKDGFIQPKYVGRIYLKGLTLQNAIQVIKARYSRAYMIENSQFDVTLNYSRVINVNVVGEVELPGSYTVPAINTVFNLMSFIGGPTKLGSIRNIQIKRNGIVIRNFDLYNFLNNPTAQDDYFLQNNDYIFVPMSNKLVTITGAIQRPFKYELLEKETFEDLLKYAGGYKANALTNYLQILRFVNNKAVIIDVDMDSLRASKGKLKLLNGDAITVRTIPEEAINFVNVDGAVNVTGKYELRPGDRVSDLVNRAMGLSENAYLQEAYIFRLDPGTEGKTVIRVQIGEALSNPGSESDILLSDQDQIKVFTNDYFIDKLTINIEGEVRNPTVISAQKGLTLRDGILYAGGLKSTAYLERAFIYRIDKSNQLPIVLTVQLDTANNYASMDDIPILQGDRIKVLSNLTFLENKNVSISGAVKNPVSMQFWQGITLKDLVLLGGGFKERAFLGKVFINRTTSDFRRELITVNLDTASNYQKLDEILLQEDDNVLVFSNTIFDQPSNVFVTGMVKEDGYYDYKDGMTLSDALLLADGFLVSAATNRIEIARLSNFQDAIANSEPTKISIDILEISRDFINDPIANGYLLQPYDQIFIRRIPNFNFQKKIFIDGEVKYPGQYVLRSKEKLTSIIERAGGLTDEAFPQGTKLERKKDTRGALLVDLKKAMRRPGSKYNYILKQGDLITIPTVENIVTVRGQIDYPFEENDMKRLVMISDTISVEEYIALTPEKKVNVPYTSGKRAKYYIHKYGSGFGKYSKKKDTYVILPNGHIKGTRFMLFGRVYPKVKEGSEVVVPRKPFKRKPVKTNNGDSGAKFYTILQTTMASLTASLTLYLLLKRSFD
ncbi:MAG TPA: SLBB domain-containing protein [Chitinophagales bacterium]|nr:SLBB domain-containing protein [Chitinophagales bacterium]